MGRKTIADKLDQWRRIIAVKKAEYKTLKGQLNARKNEWTEVESRIQRLVDVQTILQSVVETVQNHVHAEASAIVSRCLVAVFGEDAYTFRIIFEQKRGRTEARMVFERGGQEFDPITETGGGVVDVAAFALRIAVILLSKPRRRRLLVLDEPFKYVSREYRSAAERLVLELAEELKFQFIIVSSHITRLEIGNMVVL